MPEKHRREEILDAVERLLSRRGIEAVTMRAVAAEADVSLRLVQYYGRTKDELLTAALGRLAEKSVRQWEDRMARGDRTAEGVIAAFLAEALPTDESSRAFHRVGVSLELRAITEPDAGASTYQDHLRDLADHLARLLDEGSNIGHAAARRIAAEVMALGHGLGTMVMSGHLDRQQATDLIGNYLAGLRPRLSG